MRKRTVFIMALVLLTALPVIALAAEINLPKTGQTTCYDEIGKVISCSGTGQDGDIKAGVDWPSPRFTENGDGTVTDNLTGLVWLRNANCISTQYSSFDMDGTAGDGAVTWQHALDFVAGINNETYLNCGAGHTDWRLPNVNELESLINAGQAVQADWLNAQGFSNVQTNVYWSSTTRAGDTDLTWLVHMHSSHVSANEKIISVSYVWPVRGTTTTPAELWRTGQTDSYALGDDGELKRGVAWPSPRFTDNADGTVTDNLTGLIWLKNANCFGAQNWWDALNSANTLNSGECGLTDGSAEGDWRLSNRIELRSLIDYSKYGPALPTGHPFINVQSSRYWSSTTYAYDMGFAWFVDRDYGYVDTNIKRYNYYYVWPVRVGTVGTFYNLDISKAGTGSGTVTSDPAGIDCGGDCTETYASGTQVRLTATPDTGSSFSGWGGDCSRCGANLTCDVVMDADRTCDAEFTDLNPSVDIKANQSDGPIDVSSGTPVSITISLNPRSLSGQNADWWIAVHTPFAAPGDWYTYVYPTGWQQGVHLCAQAGLFDLAPFEVLNMALPVGAYTFYFAVDPPDGIPTAELLDSVAVAVTP